MCKHWAFHVELCLHRDPSFGRRLGPVSSHSATEVFQFSVNGSSSCPLSRSSLSCPLDFIPWLGLLVFSAPLAYPKFREARLAERTGTWAAWPRLGSPVRYPSSLRFLNEFRAYCRAARVCRPRGQDTPISKDSAAARRSTLLHGLLIRIICLGDRLDGSSVDQLRPCSNECHNVDQSHRVPRSHIFPLYGVRDV